MEAVACRHIAIPIFNRASYSRIKYAIDWLLKSNNFEITLILSSSLIEKEFGSGGEYVKKDFPQIQIIECTLKGPFLGHIGSVVCASQITERLGYALDSLRPDACLLVADRFETLAAATAASYLNIPIIHVQGGEITGNIDEKVRHAVTKLADYHFVSTWLAKRYVIRMGEEKSRVFKIGCPSLEMILRNNIRRKISKEKYIISMFHPDTNNIEESIKQLRALLEAIALWCKTEKHHCYLYRPNMDPGQERLFDVINEYYKLYPYTFINMVNLPPIDFLTQLAGSRFIIGNSSCGIREASFLGLPSINIGDRQGVRERSENCYDAIPDAEALQKAMAIQFHKKKYPRSGLYGDGRAGEYLAARLSNIPVFSLKPPLTYPLNNDYNDFHFSRWRLDYERRKEQFKAERKNSKRVFTESQYKAVS